MAEAVGEGTPLNRNLPPTKEASKTVKEEIGPFTRRKGQLTESDRIIIFGLKGESSVLTVSARNGMVTIEPSGMGSGALSRLEGEIVVVVEKVGVVVPGSHGFNEVYGFDKKGEKIVKLGPEEMRGKDRAGFDLKAGERVVAIPVYMKDKRGVFVCGERQYGQHKTTLGGFLADTDRDGLIREINEAKWTSKVKAPWKSFRHRI